jgi:AcrR family transcriptional regulator
VNRPGGRPRSAAADRAIREAVLDVYAEHGFAGLTVDAVAERAGVSKATIYRRHCSKSELVFDALDAVSLEDVPTPDTGTLRDDLVALGGALAAMLAIEARRAVACNMLAEVGRHEDLAAAHRRFVASRLDRLGLILERARERGEIARVPDVPTCADRLFGPIFFRTLWRGEPCDDAFVASVVAAVLHTLHHDPAAH